MKDPVIHIKKSALLKVLQELCVMFPHETTEEILQHSQPYALRDRFTVQTSTVKSSKKASKAKAYAVAEQDVELFNRLLTFRRQQLHHRFIAVNRENPLWKIMGEVTHDAIEFIKVMGIASKEDGFNHYIDRGIELMRGKYALNKFKLFRDRIAEEYSMELEIAKDPNPEKTETFIIEYINILRTETGVCIPMQELSTFQQMDLHRGRLDADNLKMKYATYIRAQFSELAYLNSVPEPAHMHGDNARNRARAYAAKKTVEHKELGTNVESMKDYYDNLSKNTKKAVQ